MCFKRCDLDDIKSEDGTENIESDFEDEGEAFVDSEEESDIYDDCLFLLTRLNHVLKKCGEEEMEESDWCEMKAENQCRVFLYVSNLKKDIWEEKEENVRQEKSETDNIEKEFDRMVNRIITENYLETEW